MQIFSHIYTGQHTKKEEEDDFSDFSGYGYGYTESKPCLPLHLKPLKCFNGSLYGFSGKYHSEHSHDLNIFLTDTWLPAIPLVSGKIQSYGSSKPTIYYEIADRHAPRNEGGFNFLLRTTVDYLKMGKSVAVSCLGGHGRTGLVLACLWQISHPTCKDPIFAIRQQGCKKWVESEEQARYILQRFKLPWNKEYADFIREFKNYTGKGYVVTSKPKEEPKNEKPITSDTPSVEPRNSHVWSIGDYRKAGT